MDHLLIGSCRKAAGRVPSNGSHPLRASSRIPPGRVGQVWASRLAIAPPSAADPPPTVSEPSDRPSAELPPMLPRPMPAAHAKRRGRGPRALHRRERRPGRRPAAVGDLAQEERPDRRVAPTVLALLRARVGAAPLRPPWRQQMRGGIRLGAVESIGVTRFRPESWARLGAAVFETMPLGGLPIPVNWIHRRRCRGPPCCSVCLVRIVVGRPTAEAPSRCARTS